METPKFDEIRGIQRLARCKDSQTQGPHAGRVPSRKCGYGAFAKSESFLVKIFTQAEMVGIIWGLLRLDENLLQLCGFLGLLR